MLTSQSSREADLELIRQKLELTEAALRTARAALSLFETRVNFAWSKKKAALTSRALTHRNAAACGLAGSPVVAASLRRFDDRVEDATCEIRAIIQESQQVWHAFAAAWDDRLSVRKHQIAVLEQLAPLEPDCSTALESTLTTSQTPTPDSQRPTLIRQLSAAREQITHEEAQSKRELLLPDEAHYDPQYDEVEILQRRNRPWV
jgi:hypothetical protein